jgi:hypothetical protein
MTDKLNELLNAARQREMSADDTEVQRVSFVYGNAPEEDRGTKETVRAASIYAKKVAEEK